MLTPALYRDADWIWNKHRQNPIVDQDIVSFCAPFPHLIELAFALADHGHTHVGHVARLTDFTVSDLADTRPGLAGELRLRLQHFGLDLEMALDGWTAPPADAIEALLD
jgi:hypothetical protein